MTVCRENGLDFVGAGMSLAEASQTLYREILGQRLAIINCCEHEFSIATETTAGSNPLNPIQQYYAIQEARKNADVVLVIVHGGHEHYQLPSPRMKETFRFFVDAGADAVINHHQNCFSGYEYYRGKPICYGLGNFCFDKEMRKSDIWYEGLLCAMNFTSVVEVSMIPYVQCLNSPAVTPLAPNNDKFSKNLNTLNAVIADDSLLQKEYDEFLRCTARAYIRVFDSHERIKFILGKLGIRKERLPKQKLLRIVDYVNCESHYDRLKDAIRRELSKPNIRSYKFQ